MTRIGLLVAGLAAAVGLSTCYLVERALTEDHERSTAEQFRTNAAALRAGVANPDVDELELLESLRPEVAARDLLLTHGEWIPASIEVAPGDLPDRLIDEVTAGNSTREEVGISGDRYTVYGTPLTDDVFYFEGFSLADLDDTLGTLRATLVVVGVLVTGAGMAITAWISRGIARPLERVSSVAGELAAGDLRARIDHHADDEVARISASFNRMAEALQARIERETRFTADVSHELRSPLTTIGNAVSVLESRIDELPSDAAEAVTLLAGDVARFERLVTDLVEISKHDAGAVSVDLEEVALSSAVAGSVRRLGLADVVATTPSAETATVRIDTQRLDRILANLVENAEAYGGGVTRIVVDATDDRVEVAVDDAGPGVGPDEREHIFERFARGVHGERRTTADGSGLGLALVRENATLLGGAVAVSDAPGGGARFTVRFPRTR